MSPSFFPNITRTETYETKDDGSYYSYSYYRMQVSTDCQQRCVYCDAMINEIGHEGFNLDHFRPQEIFPELSDSPENLVIACSKCNRWKSSHWPIDKNSKESHDGFVGFVEPFKHNRQEYFNVENCGTITAVKGPSEYIVKLLHLNRPSRILIRRNRLLSCRIDDLLKLADFTIDEATALLKKGQPRAEVIEMLERARSAITEIKLIKDSISAA
jgi:hypothetical protein